MSRSQGDEPLRNLTHVCDSWLSDDVSSMVSSIDDKYSWCTT
jgi:hypothetical protein